MLLGPRHIFIDESGDAIVHHEGASELFVLSAVIVDSSKLEGQEKLVRELIQEYFPKGEIKSSKIGSKVGRRRDLLTKVSELDVKFYSQVINKADVFSDSGLAFKKSFIKFIHRSFYQRLFSTYSSLYLVADEHGSSAFMQEFKNYLQKHMPPTLFESASFDFADSQESPLIQVADLIAGTIRRVYCGKDPIELLSIVDDQTVIIDEWPPKVPFYNAGLPDQPTLEKFDHLVRQQAVEQALSFVDSQTNTSDSSLEAQVSAVRYLLYYFRSIDPEEYVPTSKLRYHLAEVGFPMSERQIRTKVIAKLRDRSVFVVSSSKGIKLPYSVSEINGFVQQVNSKVLPYLRRLRVLRDHFSLRTEGELEVVDKTQFPELSKIMKKGV